MSSKHHCSDKPVWTLKSFVGVLPRMPGHLARVTPTVFGRTLSNAFRERIMLAVTAENQCRYCRVAHTGLAHLSNVERQDVLSILSGQDENLPADEQLALAFVRDLAARDFQSRDHSLYAQVGQHFSDKQRAAIESSAHIINFGNRFGNTIDAAFSRVRAVFC